MTLKEVHPTVFRGLALTGVSVGVHDSAKKSLLEQVLPALLARFAIAHSEMTVCSTSNLGEKCELLKKRRHKRSTKFSEFNSMSIESSDSEQHNEGSQESGNRKSQNKQPGTK